MLRINPWEPCLLPLRSMLASVRNITENLREGRIKILSKDTNVPCQTKRRLPRLDAWS